MGLAGKNNQSKYNETVNRGGSIFEAYPKNQTQGNMAIKNRIVWPTKGAYCIKKIRQTRAELIRKRRRMAKWSRITREEEPQHMLLLQLLGCRTSEDIPVMEADKPFISAVTGGAALGAF